VTRSALGHPFTGTAAGRRTAHVLNDGVPAVARNVAALGLIATMAVGSLALWTVIPVGVLWLVYRPSNAYGNLAAWSFPVVALVIAAAMATTTEILALLERAYMHVRGTRPNGSARVAPAWRRSLSDCRAPAQSGVLCTIMVASVLLAIGAFIVWFLVAAKTIFVT
jgi:hypothetical protein